MTVLPRYLLYTRHHDPLCIICQDAESIVLRRFLMGHTIDTFPDVVHPTTAATPSQQPHHTGPLPLVSPHSTPQTLMPAALSSGEPTAPIHGRVTTYTHVVVTSTIGDASPSFLQSTRFPDNRRGQRHYSRREARNKARKRRRIRIHLDIFFLNRKAPSTTQRILASR